MAIKTFPRAAAHGELQEIFPDVFFVSGAMAMKAGPVQLAFSRAMTIIRQDGSLIIVNSMRLGEQGLAALDALGKVTHVLRIGGFHGRDDAFYQDRYGAKVLAIKGQRYVRGFKQDAKPYFTPDQEIDPSSELPIEGAKLFVFGSCKVPEAILLLDRNGGIAITCDSLQNWATADEFFNLPGKLMMKMMRFIKPHNVGPGWLKETKPSAADLRAILELPFDNVLPGHGSPVLGGARDKYRPAITHAAGRA